MSLAVAVAVQASGRRGLLAEGAGIEAVGAGAPAGFAVLKIAPGGGAS